MIDLGIGLLRIMWEPHLMQNMLLIFVYWNVSDELGLLVHLAKP